MVFIPPVPEEPEPPEPVLPPEKPVFPEGAYIEEPSPTNSLADPFETWRRRKDAAADVAAVGEGEEDPTTPAEKVRAKIILQFGTAAEGVMSVFRQQRVLVDHGR